MRPKGSAPERDESFARAFSLPLPLSPFLLPPRSTSCSQGSCRRRSQTRIARENPNLRAHDGENTRGGKGGGEGGFPADRARA
jgi:hypothetical protein